MTEPSLTHSICGGDTGKNVLSNTVLLNMLGKKRVYGFLLDNLVSQTMLDFTSEVRAVRPRRRALFLPGVVAVDAGNSHGLNKPRANDDRPFLILARIRMTTTVVMLN
jgi:hypothetical protein